MDKHFVSEETCDRETQLKKSKILLKSRQDVIWPCFRGYGEAA